MYYIFKSKLYFHIMLFFMHFLCLSQTRRSLCPSVLPAPTRINRLLLCPDQITVASCWKWVVVVVGGVHAQSRSAAPQGSFRCCAGLPSASHGSSRLPARPRRLICMRCCLLETCVDGKSGAVITWGPERRAYGRVRARVKRVRKGGCVGVCARACAETQGGLRRGGGTSTAVRGQSRASVYESTSAARNSILSHHSNPPGRGVTHLNICGSL